MSMLVGFQTVMIFLISDLLADRTRPSIDELQFAGVGLKVTQEAYSQRVGVLSSDDNLHV